MPDLPARPDLGQLRHQAKDLLHTAQRGDRDATARILAVTRPQTQSRDPIARAPGYRVAPRPRGSGE